MPAGFSVRFLSLLVAVGLMSSVLVGCDGAGTAPPPAPESNVLSFEVDFVLDDLDFFGAVAAATYDAPEFTREVVDNGAVLAYFRDLEDTWAAMPFTYGIESNELAAVDYTATLGYAYERNRLDVFLEASSEHPDVHKAIRESALFEGFLPIRIVVIRGGLQMRSTVDLSDPDAVVSHFSQPE